MRKVEKGTASEIPMAKTINTLEGKRLGEMPRVDNTWEGGTERQEGSSERMGGPWLKKMNVGEATLNDS